MSRKDSNTETLSLIYEIAESRYKLAMEALEKLDTKSSAVIGFGGIILSLIFGLTPGIRGVLDLYLYIAAIALIAVSVLLALRSFAPREVKVDPSPEALRQKYSDKDVEVVLKQVTANIAAAQDEIARQGYSKGKYLKWSVTSLVLGLLILGIDAVIRLFQSP